MPSVFDVLERVPFRSLKRGVRIVRRRYATVEWPESPESITFSVAWEDHGKLECDLRQHHFESAEKYSLNYRGEVLNMRRPLIHHHRAGELHVRTRNVEQMSTNLNPKCEMIAHREYSRFEEITRHVEGGGKDLEWLTEDELTDLFREVNPYAKD